MTSHCFAAWQNHAEHDGHAVHDCHKKAAIPNEVPTFKTSCLRCAERVLNAGWRQQNS